jgi:peptide/nickel transport system ATP-binding protein
MLEEVGFDEIERTFAAYPHQLSGGQRQRVAIAQALACRPRLVIADEPTASVDAASQAGILALLKELKDRLGVAFLLISHRPNVLAELADRVVVMHDGRIVEEGPTAQVLDGVQRQDPATTSSPAQQSNRTHTSESDETGHLLRVQGLTKAYTQGSGLFGKRFAVPALCGVDLEIARGGTLVLVGESGSGKSTMARCAAGLESYDSGTVSFDGRNLAGLNSAEMACIRRQVQVVFQDSASALNPQFTAAEIVAEPLAIQRTGKPEERMKRALELMEQVELSREWAERRPLEFSGGQRQRLAIARALALRPKLLILDESLSGLDSRTQLQVVRLLNELQAEYGLTYLYITHDLNFARHVPGEVAVMSKGKVIERGETEEVFAHPRQPQTQALLAFLPAAEPVGAGTAA